ncbi:DUF2298 domain-containing protein [Dictyobacter kobayashii]|uniref:Chlor_Arch_YYY domain-containing protein n=1 Tax=Dictyobacter kobayashii TaxID=2014872 RepID=A0A402AEE7_9CHLR|nr:DUF2298 domain-containing protein [Dictyobacter kobayashii]GCE17465.1 hypothetical protein KDK_12650 [Dictyobacter kobayashii]
MIELVQLWALIEVLGLLCLPLAFTVFRNLPDRGWAFSKLLGVAILTFCVWFLLICLHSLIYCQLFILGITLMLAAGSGFAYLSLFPQIWQLVRHNRVYIITSEIIFFCMMGLLGVLRSLKPDIRGYEMFMDEGFVSSIMRSPHFPPNDMWYAGHSINYYYYAHYTMATLAKLLGQTSSVAFNTGICFFYGVTALNLFGVTCNIVGCARQWRQRVQENNDAIQQSQLMPAIPYGLLSVMMALVLGNLASTQQWWAHHGDFGFQFNWFAPSRVIDNTINEFPAFSFVLSCFHAHVLTLAFTILCIGIALNWFLEPNGKGMNLFGIGKTRYLNLFVTSLLLGGLFVMNGWDYPTYMGLTLLCVFIQQYLAHRPALCLATFLNTGIISFYLLAISYNLYLPFYLNFISPSQGIGIIPLANHSPISDEILIYGLFIFMFLSLLVGSALLRPLRAPVPDSEEVAVAMPVGSEPVIMQAATFEPAPGIENAFQGHDDPLMDAVSVSVGVIDSESKPVQRRMLPPEQRRRRVLLGLCLSVGLFFLLCLVALVFLPAYSTCIASVALALAGFILVLYHRENRAHAFTLLLGSVAFMIIAGCEVFYLKDVFAGGPALRMNTVFKFYFQAWALLSICSGAGLYFILSSIRVLAQRSNRSRWLWRSGLGMWSLALGALLLASMAYPILAPPVRYGRIDLNHPQPYLAETYTLDGMAYLATCRPPDCDYDTSADYAAIRWLNANVVGDPIIVEANGDDYRFVSARVSVFTGLPTLINWPGHEYQWRVTWLADMKHPENQLDFNNRIADIDKIYTNTSSTVVLNTLKHYNAQYVYVGFFEYKKYPGVDLKRFGAFMQIVYSTQGVSIYKVKAEN